MTAVRSGMRGPPGKSSDHPDIRPPTDATQWRPYLRPKLIIRFPFAVLSYPLTANRYHLP
jgi:hypothetical protein